MTRAVLSDLFGTLVPSPPSADLFTITVFACVLGIRKPDARYCEWTSMNGTVRPSRASPKFRG